MDQMVRKMWWGSIQVDETVGPASAFVVAGLAERGLSFGEKRVVHSFVPSYGGFEHHLGLAVGAGSRGSAHLKRGGVPLWQYYLERCLLESAAVGQLARAKIMCQGAPNLGAMRVKLVEEMLFSREELYHEQIGIPEIKVTPASRVGLPLSEVQRTLDGLSGSELSQAASAAVAAAIRVAELEDDPWSGKEDFSGLKLGGGYCYLLAFKPGCVQDAALAYGRFPKLVDLVRAPPLWFKDNEQLGKYGWSATAGPVIHLYRLEEDGVKPSLSSEDVGTVGTLESRWDKVVQPKFAYGLRVKARKSEWVNDVAMVNLGVAESGAVQLWLTPVVKMSDVESLSVWIPIVLRTTEPGALGVWHMDEAYASHKIRVKLDGLVHEFPKFGGLSVEFEGQVELEIQFVGLTSLACRVYQYDVVTGEPLGRLNLAETAGSKGIWASAVQTCRQFLRVGGEGSLEDWLVVHVAGFREFKPGRMEVVTASAALLAADGRDQLRMLEALGDAAITRHLAKRCLSEGKSAGVYQDLRSNLTSNAKLAALFMGNFVGMVRFVSGVNPSTGVGAKAFEAIVGAVDEAMGDSGVDSLLDAVAFASAV